MESKFHLLNIGQHFQWDGKSYVKSSPLIATEVPGGGQKFMPRAALVQLLDATGAPEPSAPLSVSLDAATVRDAIQRYHQRCVQLSTASTRQAASSIEQLEGELEQLYRDLLLELNL